MSHADSDRPTVFRTVISVGQCGFDNSRIRELIRSVDPAIDIRFTDTFSETLKTLDDLDGRVALVMINRIMDLDGASGLELIHEILHSDRHTHVPVMLVSDYEHAQAAAIAEGALPGFGKSSLRAETTKERLNSILKS